MAKAPRRGFPQQNIQKAGVKSGTGAAYGSDEIAPIAPLISGSDPDRFGVEGADARDQEAEEVNGHNENTKSGPVPFANGPEFSR